MRIPLGDVAAARYGHPYGVIHRADLQGALLAAVTGEPAIALRLGAKVTGLAQRDAALTLHLGDDETLDAEIVVGADGVHSRLRTACFGHPPVRSLGRVAWRARIAARGAGRPGRPAGHWRPGSPAAPTWCTTRCAAAMR